jgi:hypothetical protein
VITYRFYLFNEENKIAGVRVHQLAGDHVVEEWATAILEAAPSYVILIEAWDGARRICRLPRKQSLLKRAVVVWWPRLKVS